MNTGSARISVTIVAQKLTKTNQAREITLNCACSLEKVSNKFFSGINAILDEIWNSQSWLMEVKFAAILRYSAFLKILCKNPTLGFNLIFTRQNYNLVIRSDCFSHKLKLDSRKNVWYARSSAMVGFPWCREVFVNALDMTRKRNIDFFVFCTKPEMLRHSFETSYTTSELQLHENLIKIDRGQHENRISEFLASWNSTEFHEYSEARILHGSFLVQDNHFVETDLSNNWRSFPNRFSPCSLWPASSSLGLNYMLSMPIKKEIYIDKRVLFLQGNVNFYHFLAESIRPIIFVLENDVQVDAVAVRDDLPKQFYEIIQWLIPNIEVIKVSKEESLSAKSVITSVLSSRMSKNGSMFTGIASDFQEDEWKVFSFLRRRQNFTLAVNEVLYLPREKQESRGIINNRQVEKMFLSNGGSTIDPNSMSWHSQLEKFEASRIFVSAGGASLTNAIFLPRGSTLIELTYPWGDNWNLLSIFCDLQYVKFPLKKILPGRLSTVADSYLVSTRKLESLILSKVD
jgi:hypothetical protein